MAALAVPGATQATSFNEVKKITASDAQFLGTFGQSVAVSGDTAVVGARLEDAKGFNAGAAYVYQRDEGEAANWGEVKKLGTFEATAIDFFVVSVAVSGDTAIVGAWGEGDDVGGVQAGAAYIFHRNEGGTDNWGEVKRLAASDAQFHDWFGVSVAVSGDTAVVGAWGESTGGALAGAAYIFQRNEGGTDNWGEVKKLIASEAQAGDQFGWSVAVDGDTAVVGAVGEDRATYVFQRNEGSADNWGEVEKLIALDAAPADRFGVSVAISGDTAIVGANQDNAGGFDAGAAYVFQRDEGGNDNWGEVKKLIASDADTEDQFGISVAISGNTTVVGAWAEDAGGTQAGAAYIFRLDEGGTDNWGEIEKLTASDAEDFDVFGFSVALSGDTAVVGAWGEDSEVEEAGAAYVFGPVSLESTPTHTPTDTPSPVATVTPTPNIPAGDASCDGITNPLDAALILQFSADLIGSLPCAGVADVNEDGVTDPVDAALVLQFVAGLIDSL